MADPATNQPGFFSNPAGDLIGGLTAAIIALPLALAFGVASGLGAIAGLYGAIACGILAALFGGTPGQVSGPTGPMTVVTTALLLAHPGRPDLVLAAVILAGGLQIALGLFRLGDLIHYMPYPVISGFMTGIGVIIIVLQVPALFGLRAEGGVVALLRDVYPTIPGNVNPAAAALGIGTFVAIVVLRRLSRRVPATLVALVLATLAAALLGLQVPVIGPIPGGLPTPSLPRITVPELRVLIEAGIALALLGSIDSLLTSVVVDKMTGRRHDSNRELVGQGLGNMASGLIGGLPGAGATMRSVVNIQSGGRSNLSGTFHGVVLLAVLLGLGTLTARIPLACLAGILIHVGVTIIDYRGVKGVRKAPWSDTFVMVVVLGLTVFVDLIIAVLVGIALASVLFVKNLSDARPSVHGPVPDDDLPVGLKGAVYSYAFRGPLYFGEAKNFGEVVSRLAGVRHVILVFDHVPLIDQTGAFAVEDAIEQLQAKGVGVYLVHPYPHVREGLEKIATNPDRIRGACVGSVDEALEAIRASVPGRPPAAEAP